MTNRAPYRSFKGESISPIVSESREHPVVMLFTADWLGSAHILETFLKELAPDFPMLAIYEINVDNNQQVTTEFGVAEVPTTVFLKDGEICELVTGILSKRKLRDKVELLLAP